MQYLKYVLILSAFLSSNVFSETYLCIGDKGAEITSTGQTIHSQVVSAENLKLILSNESGKWELKYHGGAPTGLDKCINGALCETSGDGFGGTFFKNKSNVFTFHTLRNYPNNQHKVTDALIKGLCTKL